MSLASEICSDGEENNCDGLVDCQDSDCSVDPTSFEQDCSDGLVLMEMGTQTAETSNARRSLLWRNM